MSEEIIEVMSKLQSKAIRYKSQRRLQCAFNDDEYYSYILFNYIQDLKQENTQLKSVLKEIREYIWSNKFEWGDLEEDNEDFDIDGHEILQIIDKGIGEYNG